MAESDTDEQSEVERLRRTLERERAIRRQAEAIAEDATRRLYEADRLKSLFVSTVSHELRTPLTPILGFAEGLARTWDKVDDETRRDIIARIHSNASTLSLLIESLLDFSQLEQTRLRITIENVALGQEVRRLVDQLASVADRHRLETDCAGSVVVRADRAALARITHNLVSNAVKYTPEGGRILVATRSDGDTGILEVTDDGPGVVPAERERIFDRFYRSNAQEGGRARGLGIGLALVRALAESMGGSTGIDDAPQGGARFWVRLPLATTP
ncbi:MAG: HAMP domain-containing histidine kinase [Actinobacteria bacterium]|nr:HAMP domain-containing histidine kinase [Actinomycetota bacterium]